MPPVSSAPTPANRSITRTTRSQAAKAVPSTSQPPLTGSTGGKAGGSLFSRSKEGFRKVSDKLKEKEKEKDLGGVQHHEMAGAGLTSASSSVQSVASLESLKVS